MKVKKKRKQKNVIKKYDRLVLWRTFFLKRYKFCDTTFYYRIVNAIQICIIVLIKNILFVFHMLDFKLLTINFRVIDLFKPCNQQRSQKRRGLRESPSTVKNPPRFGVVARDVPFSVFPSFDAWS